MSLNALRCAPRRAHHRALTTGLTAIAAGGATLALAAPAGAVGVEPPTLLALGSSGPAVAEIQHALHLPAGGFFGPKTRRAVRLFQHRQGIGIDGIVGPETWDTLFHIAPTSTSTPATATAATAVTRTSTVATGSGSGGYSIPSSIVQCESGGNYSAVNSSSGAGGAYQIMPGTWHAYGGQGLPQNAPAAEQNRIASQIYATQGRSAWSC